MDCNGLLWISKNQVNGFEDASMDCYGMFKKRGPDTKEHRLRSPYFIGFAGFVSNLTTGLLPNSGVNSHIF